MKSANAYFRFKKVMQLIAQCENSPKTEKRAPEFQIQNDKSSFRSLIWEPKVTDHIQFRNNLMKIFDFFVKMEPYVN